MKKTIVKAKDLSIDDHFNLAGNLYRISKLNVGAFYVEMEAYLVDDKKNEIDLTVTIDTEFVIYNQ